MQQKNKIYILDRFEGTLAILEDAETLEITEIARMQIPECAKEGDCLLESDGVLQIDAQETQKRETRIKAKQAELFK